MKQQLHDDVELRAALNALGTVTLNESRAFEEDLNALDEASKSELAGYGSVANLLAFGASEIEPPVGVWDKLCAVMEAEPKPRMAKAEGMEIAAQTIQQLASSPLLTVRKEEGDYLEVVEGIFVKVLFQNEKAGTTTYLVKFMPGARTPKHRHPGLEECMVVEGDFQVDGKDLRAGDYHCAMPGSVHDRPYSVNGATVLIVAEGQYEVLAN
jgi:quercetin dioxygenase-like cupin family protein